MLGIVLALMGVATSAEAEEATFCASLTSGFVDSFKAAAENPAATEADKHDLEMLMKLRERAYTQATAMVEELHLPQAEKDAMTARITARGQQLAEDQNKLWDALDGCYILYDVE